MKSILFVLNAGVGGAERMTVLYAKLLHQQGYDCKLAIIKSRQKGFAIKPFIGNDLKYDIIDCRFDKLVFLYLTLYLIKNKFDIVFSSLSYLNNIVLWCKTKGIHKGKVVIRMNTMPSRLSDSRIKNCKKLFPHADAIISQTEEMKQEMISIYGLSEESITVINNPIDETYIAECLKETFDFDKNYTNYVAVGRVNPIKDYKTLLSAFVMVREKQPNSRLYIIGDLASEEQMQVYYDFLKKNNAQEFVFFEGFQRNPYKYLNGCDAYVLSSIKEGLPNALLEAMYLNKPVISTRCLPFVEQVIKEGENGFSIPVGNAVAMAEAMLRGVSIKSPKPSQCLTNSKNTLLEIFDFL